MFGRVLAWAAAIVAGSIVGLASAWATLEIGRSQFMERYGAWTHSRAAGSEAAGPYTRAIIARDGLLALSAREAVYFTLFEDENGRRLSEACVYELTGGEPEARWWSVTLYAADSFLAQNNDHAPSVDASHVRYDDDNLWRIRISPVRGDAANWISSRSAGRDFSLTLRVYNPQRDFRASAETLPALRTLSCEGA
ncbi:MAG: DUF1214 domain-containing protein [Hyphomonadaceae bacterium]